MNKNQKGKTKGQSNTHACPPCRIPQRMNMCRYFGFDFVAKGAEEMSTHV